MRVFVCSPLRGDIVGNLDRARAYCRQVMAAGHTPFCPHLFFCTFLDDLVPAERDAGMAMALVELAGCGDVWAFGGPSEGMRAEIALAESLGIPVKRLDREGKESEHGRELVNP